MMASGAPLDDTIAHRLIDIAIRNRADDGHEIDRARVAAWSTRPVPLSVDTRTEDEKAAEVHRLMSWALWDLEIVTDDAVCSWVVSHLDPDEIAEREAAIAELIDTIARPWEIRLAGTAGPGLRSSITGDPITGGHVVLHDRMNEEDGPVLAPADIAKLAELVPGIGTVLHGVAIPDGLGTKISRLITDLNDPSKAQGPLVDEALEACVDAQLLFDQVAARIGQRITDYERCRRVEDATYEAFTFTTGLVDLWDVLMDVCDDPDAAIAPILKARREAVPA
jgi:hypothetical protein